MRADRVEISWDAAETNWLLRIESGDEVIRRHCRAPKDTDEPTLRSLVEKTIKDEGYEAEPARIFIRR